jgi:hypothetical protein
MLGVGVVHLCSADYSSKVAVFTALGLDVDLLLIGFNSVLYIWINLRQEGVGLPLPVARIIAVLLLWHMYPWATQSRMPMICSTRDCIKNLSQQESAGCQGVAMQMTCKGNKNNEIHHGH